MKTKDFDILFKGLSLGSHDFEYDLNDSFFELFNYTDYTGLQGKARMKMLKSETVLDLEFTFEGSITAPCDVTNEPFDQALEGAFDIKVKFGEEFNNENEELLILPHGEHQFNVAQYIYELIVLNVPSKLLGPNAGNGLEDYIEEEDDNETKDTDPRWDQLKNLLNK